jgi:BirA family biotin operon repressor/biotin-[acetyl-CoA-carboxylase] ligase
MKKFIHVDRCESTQELIKEQLGLDHHCEDLAVSCEHQINGFGRGSNTWTDSSGTICFSMTIIPNKNITFTPLEISLLVRNFFLLKGKDIKVKWPNDLINSEGKKCGGVIVQNSGSHFYAGIGLNLFQNDPSYGGIYEAEFALDKKEWAKELSTFIWLNRYAGHEEISADWLKGCHHLNRHVKIVDGDHEATGEFIGLGPFGEAVLKNPQGTVHLYNGSLRLI